MATGATIASLIATTAGTISSIDARNDAKKEARKQQEEIDKQNQKALSERKTKIDEMRYNLLGSSSSSGNSSGSSLSNFNLLGNKVLG